MPRPWAWAKIRFRYLRHLGWWRLAWAAALVLGLWSWELLQGIEGHTRATTLTLLFRPEVEESDIRAFLQSLPKAHRSALKTPAQLWADSSRLLEKLGPWPEGGAPEDSAGIGWAAELHWRGLSSELTRQLHGRLEEAPWLEEAYWARPAPHAALAGLQRAARMLFVFSLGAVLVVLSIGCLHAEAGCLKTLLELGATPGQIRRFWLTQGLAWAVVAGAVAHGVWKAAFTSWGAPDLSPGWQRFILWGVAYGGAGLLLAWALRGRACCS